MDNPVENLQVGKLQIPFDVARRWIADYTNEANGWSTNPYAFPAYDRYQQQHNDPSRLTDADLLAPGLLNVPVKLRTFYGLRHVRAKLELALANNDLGFDLATIEDSTRIAGMIKPLYAVLDDPVTSPWGVGVTLLSKVLHRKRPKSIVLHDKWVQRCYVGKDAPVVPVKGRSWSDYMTAITEAIARDIRTQAGVFTLLDRATSSPGELSHVRLLDILAWQSKGQPPREAADGA
ncbi:DUF6308 family protein [Mycolicibacterium llatzerense]|uniref:DUF6308 family protein n=1 Tax=Mycolicibacterium llatzerense TaxID=280871 RepID=UPI0013A6CFA7|nr:DUF6308 family protein [Mycolicibacterium llatzerense]